MDTLYTYWLLIVFCREETDRAVNKANSLEKIANEANEKAEKMEDKQRSFHLQPK